MAFLVLATSMPQNNHSNLGQNWHAVCYLWRMSIFSKDSGSGRELVPTGVVSEMDRDEMRGWIQTLRREAETLRTQATHMNNVAQDAEVLAERIEHVLRSV